MFTYCGNNPANNSDATGHFWAEIWEFVKEAFCETGSAMASLSPAYAGCGGLAAADGPLPVGDIIGLVGATFLTIGSLGYGIYQAADAPSTNAPKERKSTEGNSTGIKSVVGSTPATPPDPNGNNGRKFNVHKSESPQWNRLDRVKHSNLRTSGRGSNQMFYDWDYTHNDIEVYNCRGEHLGSMDPITGEMYKPPVPGRIIILP